jgi:hypothetical protein
MGLNGPPMFPKPKYIPALPKIKSTIWICEYCDVKNKKELEKCFNCGAPNKELKNG